MTQTDTVPDLTVVQNEAVPPELEHFQRCLPWIQSALEGSHVTIADVAQAIAAQKAQLWPGQNAAMVTEIEHHNGHRFARVWLAGGDLQELLGMALGLEAWARMQGCEWVTIPGRKGWERAAKSLGYEFEAILLKKVL
jgi:hypothetical protein